jgi:hypothetical protein
VSKNQDVARELIELPALAKRKAGDTHLYVIGNESVQRFLILKA